MWILGILIPPLHTLPPLKSHKNRFNTPPKVHIIRPWKKWCLEDEFPFGALPIFRGQTAVKFPGCTTYRRCQRHDFFQATPSAIPIGTKMVIILAKRADYLWMLSYFWVKDGTNIANSHIYITPKPREHLYIYINISLKQSGMLSGKYQPSATSSEDLLNLGPCLPSFHDENRQGESLIY